jgi:hypothetical protein
MRLKEFYQDKEMREEVKAFITKFLELKAIEKIYDREDTMAIADAKEIIDGAFEQLEVEFAPKPKKRDLNNAI